MMHDLLQTVIEGTYRIVNFLQYAIENTIGYCAPVAYLYIQDSSIQMHDAEINGDGCGTDYHLV